MNCNVINRMQQINEKLDKVTGALEDNELQTEGLTQALSQLIKERVEAGRYNDLLTHPNSIVRELTLKHIEERNEEV